MPIKTAVNLVVLSVVLYVAINAPENRSSLDTGYEFLKNTCASWPYVKSVSNRLEKSVMNTKCLGAQHLS